MLENNMVRQSLYACLVGLAIWLTAPAQAIAQNCGPPGGSFYGSGTMNCASGNYTEQTNIYGDNLNVNVAAGATMNVPVDPGYPGSTVLATSALTIIDGANAGAGFNVNSLTINNSGSLTISDLSQGLSAQSYQFDGLYSKMAGGQGYNGGTPGNGGNTTQPLSVTNTGAITVFLPYTELQLGNALVALSQGGNGGCNNLNNGSCSISGSTEGGQGGNAAGATVNNSGAINVTVGTQGGWGGGSLGFGGIEALSQGGNAGYGNNGAYGGNSAASTVTSSAPVNVTFNWVNDNSSSGLYGILAQSQGGNGTGSKGGDNSKWAGWGGSVTGASVTLTSGGNVSLTELDSPPGQGIGSGLLANITGAGVAAEAIAGNGGNGEEENFPAGGGGYVANAPTITITDANVQVSGTGLPGLLAWSQGGNGGLGATENDGNQSGSAYSNGGPGGLVVGPTVNVTAQMQNVLISTVWNNSPAIAAFALGGAGGYTNPVNNNDGHNTDASAGAGGSVCVDTGFTGNCQSSAPTSVTLTGTNGNTVRLTTNGTTSPGIYAVSQGGNGGDGGDFLSSLSHGQGYNGGAGGLGGDVNVTLESATISTSGPTSPGIIALSQGGIGGYGGFGQGGAGQNDGGNGGNGGATGNVNVSLDSASSITTQGVDSSGIIAQTVSGPGGAGGDQQGHQGTGGLGGAGGNAGTVTVTNNGSIATSGDASRGILAQSMPGAGGSGGSAGAFFNGVGGNGGSSGSAGAVTVTNYGTITTSGTDAQGILAQSIGGGGGAGGSAGGYGAIGGSGALAAAGNAVTVNSQNGSITTSGLSAAGVLGQSIGGGGGDGGGASGANVTIGGSGGGGGAGGGVTFSSGAYSQIKTNGDYSPAVLMQSIGGGGGNAGNSSNEGLFASIAIGGTGGGGGSGGSVNLDTSHTNITTVGTKSPGLVAQSIGGGGGMGGNAFANSVGAGFAVSVGDGGSAGSGGDGGSVSASVQQETIATGQSPLLLNGNPLCTSPPCNALPVDSYGAVVQSIGGGGGLGGSATAQAVALAVPLPETNLQIGFGASASVGGQGGNGGNGGLAQFQLSNGGMIKTSGQGSTAVLVQSIGGGGGGGGDSSSLASVVGAASVPDDVTSINLAVTFELGGNSGNGGNGGTVDAVLGGTVSSSGTFSPDPSGSAPTSVVTYGDFADGVTAQSIGGGGGNAGFGSGNTQAFGAGNDMTVNVGLGGKGGSGGDGGPVNVELFPGNGITTYGSGAVGILAQSIGGGGGASQGDSFAVATPIKPGSSYILGETLNLGVSGPTGGSGGPVTVSVLAPIATHGGDATGVLAQSIGGGGGLGGSAGSDASADNPVVPVGNLRQLGSNILSTLKGDAPIQATFTQSIGGTGGSGGNGDAVSANISAPITTTGDWANGVVAQSIGGGGGKGGSAAATGTGGIPTVTINADVGVGGSGGGGGQGGQVGINLAEGSSMISTVGFGATGVIGQSIGGGGGIGADGSDQAAGSLSVGAAWGSSGGQGGAGSAASLEYSNPNGTMVATAGAAADGVELQSIGGSGGIAGAGSSIFFQKAGEWQPTGSLKLSAGGGSASSGDGGAVTFGPQQGLDTPLLISTTGNDSFGILAQSIGGGGGLVTSQPSGSSLALAIGGNSSRGDGNAVNVTLGSSSTIETTGVAAHGIVAQSIGGGGGVIRVVNAAGDTPALTTWMGNLASGPTYTASGNGGNITVEADGNIHVGGAGAVGILAQSVGGGGGLVMNGYTIQAGTPGLFVGGGSSGQGGTVSVTTKGSVSATGQNGIGIFAQSTGPGTSSNGQVNVTVNSAVIGGSGPGATFSNGGSGAVVTDTGPSGQPAQVTVNTGGSLDTLSGTNGTAILGYANVTNDGTITGSAYLNGGTMSNAGTYNPGPDMQGNLVNSGLVNLGIPDTRPLQTTTVTGDFTQTATGKLVATIDSINKTNSRLQVDGNASVAGLIVPSAITLLPGSYPVVTAGGLTASASGQPSLLFNWHTAQSGNSLTITPSSNFVPFDVSLTRSESSLGSYLTRAWNNSDAAFATRFASLSRINDAGQYRQLLDAHSGKATEAQSIALANSAGTILGAAMSCPVFVDQGVLLGEDNCVWIKATGQWTNQWGTTDTESYHVAGATYRLGGQHEIAPNWYLGGSFAAGQTWATMSGGSSGYGQTFDGSVALKHTMGPWLFAGSIALAGGEFHSNRLISLPGITATLQSNPGIFIAGGRLRGGYEFTFNGWYIRPYGDFDLIYTNLPGFQESGPSLYALNIRGGSKTSVALSPMVEFGGRVALDKATTLRPFAAVGVSFLPDNTRTIDASFAGASSADGTFQSFLKSPSVVGNFDVGVQLYRAGGFEVKAEYNVNVGSSFLSQGASARLAYHF